MQGTARNHGPTRTRVVATRLALLPLTVFACDGPAEEDLSEVTGASHPEVSLAGSQFEIDTDANLRVDDGPPSLDWATVTEARKADAPSGANDNSFGQGAKEDSPAPSVVTGSIPPQKSDLKTFGVYLETTASDARFLHLFWHRVQDPQGTTNMDFEFNKSSTLSANGVTPVRTSGDVLIQYDLSRGGTSPTLYLSRWINGTEGKTAADCEASNSLPCWATKVNLTAQGDATGSINTSAIPSSESDGLGAISARTFGEATIDFDAIAGSGCNTFGSAYLKSRSSDSFSAELKDFIAPEPLNLQNCGAIKVTKTRKHFAAGAGLKPHAGVTFTVNGESKATDANGVACFDGIPLGSSYTVTETVPTGYQGEGPKSVPVDNAADCDDATYVGETVSFENKPLSNITVSFSSQVSGGTAAKISCTDLTADPADSTPNAFDDTSETFKNLVEGTYNCTIVIDP